ncbi:MAG TPA: hypothetical protein VM557_06585 [Thermoanaerobaculia bacterium]|nr:hypothetical protein [Thermoanaerobaculia bacterium]
MTSRGEDLAQRIEQSIREAIERMVGEMRSSIDDVRTAVVQQLEAASQSVQADSKSLSVRSQLEQILAEINETVDPTPVAAPAPAASPADGSRLRRAIRAVEHGKSQVEILNALLDQLLEFGSRAALLIQKGDAFAGWKGAGFDGHGGQDESVKRFTASVDEIPDLSRLVREEKVIATNGRSIAERLGASAPASALIIPMVIKDKVAAAIYVDVTEESGADLDRSSIEILVFATGLLIDTLAIRKKTPSPSLSADEDGDATMVIPTPVAAPPERPAPRVAPRMPEPPPRPAPVSPPPDETMIVTPAPPTRSFELDSPAPPPMTFEPSGPPPVSFDPPPMSFEAPKPPPPAPPPPPATTPKAAAAGEGDRPSTQYIPPPGVVGGRFASQQAQSPEAKKHEEAKRFARLLVSEIKLYNEAKIEAGRKERDLYQRMKEDIDRSRQMYEERIPDEVRSQSNYFYDELVRILADGKADLLGL